MRKSNNARSKKIHLWYLTFWLKASRDGSALKRFLEKGAFKKLCFIAEIKSGIILTSFRDSNQTVYINWVCGTQFSHYTGLDIVVHASIETLRGYINIKSSRQPLFSSIAPHFTHLSSYTGTLTSRTRPEYTKISVVCSIPREYFA